MKGTRKRVRAANIYLENLRYAVDNGELDKFKESNRISQQCLKDIADAIRSNYDGWRLNGDIAGDIINQYGIDMVKYVLATVIKEQKWDGRYSTDNRQWLEDVPVSKSEDVRRRLTTSVHPGLLDMFMTQVRKHERGNGTTASKVRAMYEALDGMGGESDYVSTGDIVDDGGYTYEIVSVLDVKEDSGYEVALAEAVNADRGMTEFLVLLNGDVDWKDDSMEAAREFYENTDYSELDNIDEEDAEMEDSFDMYEADDDIVAAYRESGNKRSDDKNEARKRARERCAKRKKEMQAKKVAEMRKRVHASIEKSMRAAKHKDREKPVSIMAMAKKDGKSVKWNVEIKASITEKGKRYSVQGVRRLAEAMGVKPNELDVAAMYEACKQNGYNALAIENGKAKFGKVQAEKVSAAQKGFVRKHMGCTIHDMGDVFVVTNEHGKNIGEERTISGCEGLIEDYAKSKQTLNRKEAGANGASKMQRKHRESRMNADYEGALTLQEWLEKTGLDGADVYDNDFDLDGTYVDTIVTPADNYDKFVQYVCNNVEVVEKHAEDSYATVDFSKFIRSHMQVFLQWLDIDEGYYRDGLEDDDLYEYIIDQIITALSGGGSESQYREFMRLVEAGEDA